jgi:hypothetical protein
MFRTLAKEKPDTEIMGGLNVAVLKGLTILVTNASVVI